MPGGSSAQLQARGEWAEREPSWFVRLRDTVGVERPEQCCPVAAVARRRRRGRRRRRSG